MGSRESTASQLKISAPRGVARQYSGAVKSFDPTIVAGVTGHMNGDHPEDNLLIARAFGAPEAVDSEMIGVEESAGVWRISEAAGARDLRVAWPGGRITERPQIRREVVRLYQDACAKLGVAPRDEHGATQSAVGHPASATAPGVAEAAAPGAAGSAAQPDDARPFSSVLREGTWADHSDSEGAGFMERIMRGTAPLSDYVALVAQHFFMYEAIESEAARFDDEPLLAEIHPAGLARLAAIEADLQHLIGEDWRDRVAALPAVERYTDRIREVAASGWFPGYVAHHYTRYLGDLSGGQIIAKRVARQHGISDAGVEFYAFPLLGDLAEFKVRYRSALDRLGEGLSPDERERMIAEVREAYRFNTEAFVDLARATSLA